MPGCSRKGKFWEKSELVLRVMVDFNLCSRVLFGEAVMVFLEGKVLEPGGAGGARGQI